MAATKITVNHNGSLRVEGDFEIVDPEGKPFGLAGRTTIGLCRCGHSANSPSQFLHEPNNCRDDLRAPRHRRS